MRVLLAALLFPPLMVRIRAEERLRHTEFGGRRPYHFHDPRNAASGRWEMWMDGGQAQAVRNTNSQIA